MKLNFSSVIATGALLAFSAQADAQETQNLPINPPPKAVVKSVGGLYIWGDGGAWTLQQQGQPPAAQDPNQNPVPTASPSPTDVPLPAPSAATTRGAIGYVLPKDTFDPKWGSNVRAEFGASETTANMPFATGSGAPLVYNGIALGGCKTCSSTDYDARELNAKAASDYKLNNVTVTPSVTVFSAHNHQDFAGTGNSPVLEWNDVGAKLGVDTKVDLNKQVAIGVGGSYGRAQRNVTMSADANAMDTTMPHIAAGEAKITYKPKDDFSLNGFAGVGNYDTRVPGVSSAGKIDYSPSTNFYYGAGATFKFETK